MGRYADMMGVQSGAQTNNAEQLRKQQMDSAGMQVRAVSQQLDAMAKQFPAAAQEILMLKQGMTKVLVKIIGSSQSESQAPTGDLG
jgi:uncharacterized protein involved in exopolysaccharide biosynthesis